MAAAEAPAVAESAEGAGSSETEGKSSAASSAGAKSSGGSSSSTSKSTDTNGGRTVVGLMGVTVLFALIGNEIKGLSGVANGDVAGFPKTVVLGSSRIIIGGAAATAVLVLVSHAGDPGRQFAVGLSLVAMATATLVYGGPVWDALSKAIGGKPTGGTGATAPTAPQANTLDSTTTIATNLG